MPRLEVRGLSKSFGATDALANVSLDVDAGAVHAIVGENGAGKSTLMKILAGAERPDSGALGLDGGAYAPTSPIAARRAGVAVVWQEPELCPELSVAENVLLGVEPARFGVVDVRASIERVARVLGELGEHAGRLDPRRPCAKLTPAEAQLVAIARALAQSDCRLLILDEPTTRLPHGDVDRLLGVVRRLSGTGISVLYVSHFLEELERVADSYSVLRDGRLVAHGLMVGTSPDELVRLMAGRIVARRSVKSEHIPGDVAVELEELAGVRLPIEASFALRRGEVLGIAGLVGSGRTELLRAIFGLDRVRKGTLRVGAFIGPASPSKRLAQGVGMLSEDRKIEGLALSLGVAENVVMSSVSALGPPGIVLPQKRREVAARFIERLGIRCRDPDTPVRDLSGGNQQKVALARLLHRDPDVFLLDEPTRGVDVASRAEIHRMIDELALAGKAVLVVSSFLPELVEVADRIAVMRRGRLGPARPVAELDEQQILAQATGP